MSAFWLEQMTGDFLAGDSSCVFVVLVEMRKGGFGVLFQLNSFTCAVQFFLGKGGLVEHLQNGIRLYKLGSLND